MTYYSALSWERLGQKAKAKKLLRDLLAYARKLAKAEAKIDYFATSLPTMLLFDDDLAVPAGDHGAVSAGAGVLGARQEATR